MRVAITGGTGFIGHNLLKNTHAERRHDIICLVRNQSHVSKLNTLGIKALQCDLLNKNEVLRSLEGIDVIIHLAAVKQHYKDKDTIFTTNVQSTKNIVECSNNIKQLIFASSTLVTNPLDRYAESKKESERIILESGTTHTILRMGPVFGSGDSTNISKIIFQLKSGKVIPIPGNGDQILQPTYIDDVVRVISNLIMNQKFFNKTCVVAGNPISLNELVTQIEKTLNKQGKKFHVPLGILKPAIKMYQAISDNPSLTLEQLNNLNSGHLIMAKSDFETTPLSESIENMIKSSNQE